MYKHERSGLNLTLFRAYNPAIGRWLSRDPLGEGSDATRYSYCWNNPINMVDPLGLDGWSAMRAFSSGFGPHQISIGGPSTDYTEMWDPRDAGDNAASFAGFGSNVGLGFYGGSMAAGAAGGAAGASGAAAPSAGTACTVRRWTFSPHKSATKWANQQTARGWTPPQISQVLRTGNPTSATNLVNPANPATRFTDPATGHFVVIDDVTNHILQISHKFRPFLPSP